MSFIGVKAFDGTNKLSKNYSIIFQVIGAHGAVNEFIFARSIIVVVIEARSISMLVYALSIRSA